MPRSRARPVDTRPPDRPAPAAPTNGRPAEAAGPDPLVPGADARDRADRLLAEAEREAEAILARARGLADAALADADRITREASAEVGAAQAEADRIAVDARERAAETVAGADAEAERVREAAGAEQRRMVTAATVEAERLVADARERAAEAEARCESARRTAARITTEAEEEAQTIRESARQRIADARMVAERTLADAAAGAEQLRAAAAEYAEELRGRAEQIHERAREATEAAGADAARVLAEAETRAAETSAQAERERRAAAAERADVERARETAQRLMADATSRAARRAKRREIAAESRRRIREADTAAGKVPPLSFGERILLVVGVLAATVVSTLGLLSSYTALEVAAREWGWSWPWLLPVGIDVAIPAFTIIRLLLIRADMELRWVVWVPRALTAATIYLNWQAAHTLAGQIGHGALVLLWVIFSEVAAHVYASRIGAITGKRMETIRRSRWLLAPISTAVIRRRMILWEITSYTEALDRQRAHVLARADMRANHGPFWRLKAPLRERVELRLGEREPATDANHEPDRFANPDGSRTDEPVRVDLVRVEPGSRTDVVREPDAAVASPRGSRTGQVRELEPGGSRTTGPVREPRTANPAGSRTDEPASAAGARSSDGEPRAAHSTGSRTAAAHRESRTGAAEPAARQAAGSRTDDPGSTASTRSANREPRTSDSGGRAANRRSQIDAVLDLMRELGAEAVTLSVVQQRTGMGKTTAHLRLKAARQEWGGA
ncbi:DUF2637 domain-containing protein [Embleya sp. NPDC050493]|uniref:DUF2637 domain-containing protein n=1 Tax=Embleya sp. NPDC050493 TaxID=3363989 RepID=UPI0037A6C6D8